MIGIIVITHGKLAEGFLDAARLIVGKQELVVSISLTEEDSVEWLQQQIEEAIVQIDQGDGILLLVDLPGATPFNISAQLALTREKTKVITGVNLPMLLEVMLSREMASFDEAAIIAKDSGVVGIKMLPENNSGG
jgi:PTS system mannose-specific IIA component